MGKVKKSKESVKPATKLAKVASNYKTTLKSKKVSNVKKLKKPRTDSPTQKHGKVAGKKRVPAYCKDQFRKGIDALLKFEEHQDDKDLFTREKSIFLQIDSVRIPICPSRRIRLQLKHTLLTDKQEVCLIVPDLKRGRNEDHEPTIEHYEELLRSKNVTSIKRILPIRQLRVEYDQFELKRRLCGYYDYFLVAGNISGHVLYLLGKIFIEKRKAPIPIKLEANNLEESIETALKKASLHIHPKGSSFVIQFGHSEMTPEQLTDNLKSVADRLVTDFPGGWSNIRSLHIRTEKSIAIPVYYTLKSANTVNVPVIKPIRPKKFEKVTGELTTKEEISNITVHPGGKVDFKKKQTAITKNQLRKIRQGKIQKRSAKIRAKREKLNAKKDKAKSEVKIKAAKDVDIKDIQGAGDMKEKKKRIKKQKKPEENKRALEKTTKNPKKGKVSKESKSESQIALEQVISEIYAKDQSTKRIKKENIPEEPKKTEKTGKNRKRKVKKEKIVLGA